MFRHREVGGYRKKWASGGLELKTALELFSRGDSSGDKTENEPLGGKKAKQKVFMKHIVMS